MNPRFAVIFIASGLVAGNLCQGQGEAQAIMVLQRARKVADQNNERQGLPPQYPSSQPPASAAPVAPAPPPLTPEQQAVVRLSTGLNGIKSPVTPEQKDELAASLRANARGAVKPSAASINKLAADLSAALAGKTLALAQRGRLTQDLSAIFNSAALPQSQVNDIIADVPAILKKAGAAEKETLAVGADLKAIAAEVRKKA